MKALRFMLEIFLAIVLLPLIVIIEAIWLIWCIRTAKYFELSAKEGLKVWWQSIKNGIAMNKDFVINGL